jgi:hypothetical protein
MSPVNGLIIPSSRGTCHRDFFRVRPVLAERNANLRTQARWQGRVLEVAAESKAHGRIADSSGSGRCGGSRHRLADVYECPLVFRSAGLGRSTSVMNTQELARELGHPDAQKLLSGSLARLAYNGHDGFPRVIPIGFYWTGERIVVCTAPTSPKVRALSSRPEVALTIDTGTTPQEAKALLVRGLATMETVDGVPDEYIAASTNSLEESQLAEFEQNVRSVYKQMVRISIEPHWARFYDFGAGRLPAFLANLVNDN